nr:uncharacterized protein LOC106826625 [Equus asinus]
MSTQRIWRRFLCSIRRQSLACRPAPASSQEGVKLPHNDPLKCLRTDPPKSPRAGGAPPPPPSDGGLSLSGPSPASVRGRRLTHRRKSQLSRPGSKAVASSPPDRALPGARNCLCPSPRNWNPTTAARSWNHVLPPPLPPPQTPPPRNQPPARRAGSEDDGTQHHEIRRLGLLRRRCRCRSRCRHLSHRFVSAGAHNPGRLAHSPTPQAPEASAAPSTNHRAAAPPAPALMRRLLIAYRSGTWIFAHGDCYHLTTEEDIIPVDTVTQEAFSHHDVAFTSTPVLFYPDSAHPFIVKSNSSSQIAEVVLSRQRPSLFHECAFRFFSSSLQRHVINLDQGTFSYQHCLKHGNIFLRTTLDHTP